MQLRSLTVIVLLSAVCVFVDADYRLEIRVFSYNNPSHRCAGCGPQQTCCDGNRTELCSGPEQCDNFFIFCLRPLGTSELDTQFCPLGRYSTTFVPQNQDSFTFQEGELVLNGLPNPLVFTGPRWPGGAQLLAVVQDVDRNAFVQLVDSFVIDQSVEVGENFSTPTNHLGEFNFGYFVLSFRVTCTVNFYGSDCTTFCMERDDDLGHYTCDSEGNFVCRGRFQDLSTNCSGCREGYTGGNCTIDLDTCGHTTPCENGATCNNTGPDQYECLCAAGFEGDSCERETNECDPNPCRNGGTCMDMNANYSCNCVNGFTGRNCTISTCQDVWCSGNGQCMESGTGSFTCVCDLGYIGDLCGMRLPLTTTPSGTTTPSETTTPSGTATPFGNSTGTSGTSLVPVFGGVAGGLLLLVMVVVAVVICVCIRQRNKTPNDHTPPQEDIGLKPNPVYGLSTSHTPPQEDIDLKPNPVYGISVPWESQTNSDQCALDHMHRTSGTTTDIYDYVYY